MLKVLNDLHLLLLLLNAHQLNQQLALLFSAKMLPDAQLCVAGNSLQPALHLSWRSLALHQVPPSETLCEVGAGRQQAEDIGRAVEPLLALGLRLGEGSGAALAVPLLRLACALHGQMATFAEAAVADRPA